MISISQLPALNAILNSISFVLLITGFWMISKRKITLHKIFMISAFVTSILFLISYVTYHSQAGSTPFPGQGAIRPVYFFILISHVLLAAVVPVLAIMTIYRALKKQWFQHTAIASWTLPIWLYVSITGVIIYLLLYQFYRA
jgi:putative membrane protein